MTRDARLDPDNGDDLTRDGCDYCGAYVPLYWFGGEQVCSLCMDEMDEEEPE